MNGRMQAPVRLDPCDQGNDQSPRAVKISGLRLCETQITAVNTVVMYACAADVQDTYGDASGLLTLDAVPSMGLRKSAVRNADLNQWDLDGASVIVIVDKMTNDEADLMDKSSDEPFSNYEVWSRGNAASCLSYQARYFFSLSLNPHS